MKNADAIHRIASIMLETAMLSPELVFPDRKTYDVMEKMVLEYATGKSGCNWLLKMEKGKFASAVLFRCIKDLFQNCLYLQFYCCENKYRKSGLTVGLIKELISLSSKKGIRIFSARVQDWNVASWGMLVNRLGFFGFEKIYFKRVPQNDGVRIERSVLNEKDRRVIRDMLLVEMKRNRESFQINRSGLEKFADLILDKYFYFNSEDSFSVISREGNHVFSFAVCDRIRHPYKDFLSIRYFFSKDQDINSLIPLIEHSSSQRGLLEISIRVRCNDHYTEANLIKNGFVYSDTNYIKSLS